MFTGLFKTSLERFENVIINVAATAFLGMLFVKILGLADITWYHVAAPIILPIAAVIIIAILIRVMLKIGLLIYNIGEYLTSAFHGLFR